jgi:hypothetical protein
MAQSTPLTANQAALDELTRAEAACSFACFIFEFIVFSHPITFLYSW